MIAYGDSITEGALAASAGSPATSDDAITTHFVPLIASAFNAEYGQIGYGAQGFEQVGLGNVPTFPNTWNLYFTGQSRLSAGLFAVQPDYVFIFHGTNGTTTSGDVSGMIAAIRTAAPNARIFICLPPTVQVSATALSAGVTASGDAKTFYLPAAKVDTSAAGSSDGIHPYSAQDAVYGAEIITLARPDIPATVVPANNHIGIDLGIGLN
jgi:hypothetical protein